MKMSPSTDRPRLGIIGGGRAAWAFGAAWQECGWPLAGIHLRAGSRSDVHERLAVESVSIARLAGSSDVILLAVPDDAIAGVAAQLPAGQSDRWVFHASGALTSEVLAPHVNRFSLHPLLALPVPAAPSPLRGALLVFEGDAETRSLPERLAEGCGARFLEVAKESKVLYHAAAVFASNYVATMLEISRELMKDSGLPADLEPFIGSLARSAVANWETQKGRARFTGPVARGDLDVIRRHIDALRERGDLAALYAALAKETAERLKNGS